MNIKSILVDQSRHNFLEMRKDLHKMQEICFVMKTLQFVTKIIPDPLKNLPMYQVVWQQHED